MLQLASARANLLSAEVRFVRSIEARDYLLSLPRGHWQRAANLDQASAEVEMAARNLDTWKRAVALAEIEAKTNA